VIVIVLHCIVFEYL